MIPHAETKWQKVVNILAAVVIALFTAAMVGESDFEVTKYVAGLIGIYVVWLMLFRLSPSKGSQGEGGTKLLTFLLLAFVGIGVIEAIGSIDINSDVYFDSSEIAKAIDSLERTISYK